MLLCSVFRSILKGEADVGFVINRQRQGTVLCPYPFYQQDREPSPNCPITEPSSDCRMLLTYSEEFCIE